MVVDGAKHIRLLKRIMFIVCIIVLVASMMVMPASAKTITVCPSGCDYTSIKAAVTGAEVEDGDTVLVHAGSYSDTGVASILKSITLKGEGADVVTYDMGGDHLEIHGTGTVIEGLKIVNSDKGMEVKSSATNCIFRNCIFEGLSFTCGIQLFASNTTFEHNSVLNSTGAYYTIQIAGDYCKIANNTFSNNKLVSIYYVVYLDSYTGPENNNIIADNIIINNTGSGIMLYNPVVGNNIIIRNNISMNDKGIWLYDTSDNKIYLNNIIDNSVEYGGTVSSIFWNSTEQIEYVYSSTTYTNYLVNYWSDYTGSDTTPHDGIGDTAYDIPGS